MIPTNDVVWVGDPDAGWGLIGVQETPGASDVNDEIVLDQVLGLSGIFDEDGVAHSVVGDVVLDAQVVDAMDGHSSVESMMDGIVSNVT